MNTSLKVFYKTMHELQLNSSDDLDLVLSRLIHNVRFNFVNFLSLHLFYFVQIVSALQFLQENNYVHGDIKPDNILVNESGTYKLADFGSCFNISGISSTCNAPPGTIAYFSRDLVTSKKPTIQSDMWAFGISLLEVINGAHPCLCENELQQFLKVLTWIPEIPTRQITEHLSVVISQL